MGCHALPYGLREALRPARDEAPYAWYRPHGGECEEEQPRRAQAGRAPQGWQGGAACGAAVLGWSSLRCDCQPLASRVALTATSLRVRSSSSTFVVSVRPSRSTHKVCNLGDIQKWSVCKCSDAHNVHGLTLRLSLCCGRAIHAASTVCT